MTAPRIYLDHHATTPVDSRVAAAVVEAMMEVFGNPNSMHHAFGREAAALVDASAREVARLVGAEPEDVRFTGGASPAIQLAIAFAEERAPTLPLRVAASTIEHPAVLEALERGVAAGRMTVDWINVDEDGVVSLNEIAMVLERGVDLLCLMAANNEVGSIQPFAEAIGLAHDAGAAVLVDATQAAGRVPIATRNLDIDYLVLSAHKIYGPKGVGALVGLDLADAAPPERLSDHVSTTNVPAIAGFGEACRLRRLEMAEDELRIAALRDRLQDALLAGVSGLVVNGSPTRRLSNNLHVSVPDAPNDAVVAHLAATIALSTGAACVSGADAPSHVLRAMGLSQWRQDGALRISLGRFNTPEEIERAAGAIIAAVRDVQSLVEATH